jgi:hypothetical protein
MNATTTVTHDLNWYTEKFATMLDGTKLTAEWLQDMDATMRAAFSDFATDYATTYNGTFAYMLNVQEQLKWGLSLAQVAGVVNCAVNEYKYNQRKNAPAPATTASNVTYDHSRQFVSDGYYTVVGPKGGHRTLRLQTIEDDKGNVVKQWLSYLNGSDNTGDYLSIGTIFGNEVKLFRKNEGKYQDIVAAAKFLIRNTDKIDECGRQYAIRSGKCYLCNRLLTTPESVARGLGPICAAK